MTTSAGGVAAGGPGGNATMRSLLRLRPSPPQWPSAARAGVCILVPLATGMLAGRLDLGLIASLGAFAVMFTGGGRWPRLATTAAAGVGITAGVLLGRLVADHPWWIGACTAAFAAASTIAWEWGRLGMPGMPLLVLPCALSLGIPPGNTWRDVGLCAAVALLACLINLPSPRGHGRRARSRAAGAVSVEDATSLRRLRLRSWPGVVTSPPLGILLMSARVGAAVLLAAVATQLAGLEHPSWAMATAAAVLGLGSQHRAVVDRAMHRTVGTVAGVGVAALVLVVEPRGWILVVILTLLQGAIQLVVARNYAMSMLFITPVALLLHSVLSEPAAVSELVALRIGETVIGSAAGVLVAYLAFRPSWTAPLLRHTVRTTLHAATSLHALQRELSGGGHAAPRASGEAAIRLELRLSRRLEDLSRSVERTTAERSAVRREAAGLVPLIDATLSTGREVLAAAKGRTTDPTLGSRLQALTDRAG